ncbi:MAG: glycyl-radical enzyme activating protein [Anaerolineales bacterium]|jgi:pyruvate formate lyase activating enzyme
MEPVGCVFDIQRYSLHDGPGIRSVVFLKGCSLQCAWCANPESQQPDPELMLTSFPCIDCGLCLQACDNRALRIDHPTPDNSAPVIDWEPCDDCLRCADICPSGSLAQIGTIQSAAEIIARVKRDLPFYRQSGGGVTLSGGEPLLQPTFACEILKRCRGLQINTALESSGNAPWEAWAKVLPFCDRVYLDLKHLDEPAHQRGTGVSNKLILQNLERLTLEDIELVIRLPLVPGFNDDRSHLQRLAGYLLGLRQYLAVELIPHHKLGCFKYERLRRSASVDTFEAYDPIRLEQRQAWLQEAGIKALKLV